MSVTIDYIIIEDECNKSKYPRIALNVEVHINQEITSRRKNSISVKGLLKGDRNGSNHLTNLLPIII